MRSSATQSAAPIVPRSSLVDRFLSTRETTLEIVSNLTAEDMLLQSMADASPAKWHLAHTTWFFETFLLSSANRELLGLPPYQVYHADFSYLFNSYYNAVGDRHPRPSRGMLSRPSSEEVFRYRKHVDQAMLELLQNDLPADISAIAELGIQHEQQHQELILTDIKHALSLNPIQPSVFDMDDKHNMSRTNVDVKNNHHVNGSSTTGTWTNFAPGVYEIGYSGSDFCFDNEQPQHRVFLESFWVSDFPVTCGEYLRFMEDGGYREPKHWLSEGWEAVQNHQWNAPLYWFQKGDQWYHYTLLGVRAIDPNSPVCHVSYYEADAYARWTGNRLPTESEWEVAAEHCSSISGNFLENRIYQPAAAPKNMKGEDSTSLRQLFGDVWEWTSSAYLAYPGYRPQPGALGEYNGKFMCSQFVLKGGSCVTPSSHIRSTYRNFFHPSKRWQFSGIRLAKSS